MLQYVESWEALTSWAKYRRFGRLSYFNEVAQGIEGIIHPTPPDLDLLNTQWPASKLNN